MKYFYSLDKLKKYVCINKIYNFTIVRKDKRFYLIKNEFWKQHKFIVSIKPLEAKEIITNYDDYFCGYWKDFKSGKEYYDINCYCDTLERAINIAKKYGQIAIYDVVNDKEIRIK